MNGTITLGGREIPYSVRASRRARGVSLRIRDAHHVEVVVPVHHVAPLPESVLRRHAGWIIRTFDRLRRAGAAQAETPFATGTRLLLLGAERTIRITREDRRRPSITLSESEIIVRLTRESPEDIRPLLGRWIRSRASSVIPARVAELNRQWNFPYASITVRNQRTRWGSCSRKGALSFNWRLTILPPDVADYLICHELAHLKYLDHSPRFWALVERICPSFRQSERWLRRHGRAVPL
ncbi:MAG TPA: SprT family zinc-dependent metalloprotease [Bacteroidota bacterium]|nr:SprT family zinc-dependent metalloprotease [Bacteroidota bacterium]